jgi:hypothetical protein
MEVIVEQQKTACPICGEQCFGAMGEGYCKDCNMTFQLRKPTRKEMLKVFSLVYYMSKNSPYYHRAGCKYIKNISPENLIEVTEPIGRPCQCVR